MLRQTAAVTVNDIRLRLRDRPALVIALLAPVVLALVASASIGRVSRTFRADIAVADLDGGAVHQVLTDSIAADPRLARVVRLHPAPSADEARRRVSDGDAAAALMVPKGFGAEVLAGRPVELHVAAGDAHPAGAALARAMARALTDQLAADQLSVRTALALRGADGPPGANLLVEAGALRLPITVDDALLSEPGGDNLAGYLGPSMAIIVLLMVTQVGMRSLVAEREAGTLARVLALGTRPAALLAGKTAVSVLLGVAAMTSSLTTVAVFTGVDWGNGLGVTALVWATVAAVGGVAALVTLAAKTEGQAVGYGLMATVTLALLGGNFVPLSQAPEWMQRVSLATPNGWSLRGFADLSVGGGLADVAPAVAVLAGFALLTGAPALLLARRMVVR